MSECLVVLEGIPALYMKSAIAGVVLISAAWALEGNMADTNDGPGSLARAPVGVTDVLETGGARIVTHSLGEGPELVLFASLGREASDFNELAEGLAAAGYRATLFEGPEWHGACASVESPTLFDLADDVGRYLATRKAPVVLVGHAFGNRLARATATRHSEAVRGVVLIAAGGLKPIPTRAAAALRDVFDPSLAPEEHTAAVRYGFFAEGNPLPEYWLRGWHQAPARIQSAATRAVDSTQWWHAGDRPLLVLAAMQDTIAPPADTVDLLEAELDDQVTAARIEGAGHALLPEAPEEILAAILGWLNTFETH